MSTTTSHHPPPKPLDLELTIISAKHLKNVNWRNGNLTPYAIFWLDPDRRLATKSDDSNSTKPVWNERFLIPIPSSSSPPTLTLEIFHSKPSDTPKPLVGSLRVPINNLPNPEDNNIIRTFDLRRPSGRVHGKIRLKLAIRDRPVPDYQIAHQVAYYYNTAIPPSYGRYPPYNTAPPPPPVPPAAPSPPPGPPPRPYHYGPYTDPYSGYYQGGYYSQPQPTPRAYSERPGYGDGGVGGPSAPVEYAQYEQKQETGRVASGAGLGMGMEEASRLDSVRRSGYGDDGGVGGPSAPVDYVQYEQKRKTGLGMESGVGAVAGGVAGLVVDEGLRYQDEKVGERVESDLNARELDDYRGYRRVDY